MPAVYKQIFDYKGKTERIDFLIGLFILAITKVSAAVLLAALGVDMEVGKGIIYILNSILLMALLSLICRRMADAGYERAGIWVLFVPVVGPFWLIFRLLAPHDYSGYQKSEEQYKEYVKDPAAYRKKYYN